VKDHAVFQIGSLRIEAIPTPGHAPGGITWFATGLAHPVAFTGDALFAGSMGGADSHWQAALDSLRLKILALPDDTILCPGHGPLTTVAWEKKHNPFA
jgi:glyoxylase-like metal-dependent hydrolase (beta-lactamase superfamily II)